MKIDELVVKLRGLKIACEQYLHPEYADLVEMAIVALSASPALSPPAEGATPRAEAMAIRHANETYAAIKNDTMGQEVAGRHWAELLDLARQLERELSQSWNAAIEGAAKAVEALNTDKHTACRSGTDGSLVHQILIGHQSEACPHYVASRVRALLR